MKIVIAGASGFIGHALWSVLRADGHEVLRLVRRADPGPDTVRWDPARQEIDFARLAGVDAFINLAGENVGAGRWTKARRERILRSRVDTTRTLALAAARLDRRPAVFVNASAVGIYGNRGDERLTETSAPGTGFLADVCRAWEREVQPAREAGLRTVVLRFGVVFGPGGGALAKLLPVFRLGLGGRLGTGRQWMNWIALDDVVGLLGAALVDQRYAGALNAVAPEVVTNARFTAELGRALHRPTWFTVPAWVMRLAFGAMADETLLSSTRATPKRLEEIGYAFRHPRLGAALAASLG